MILNRHVSTLLCVLYAIEAAFCEAKPNNKQMTSPDGKISIIIDVKEKLEPYPSGVRLYYSVSYKNRPIITDSPFGLDFKNMPPLARDLQITDTKINTVNETWEYHFGKAGTICNNYNEMVITLQETQPPQRQLLMTFRAFNDGIAFRYELPEQPGIGNFSLSNERSEFHFTDNHTVWAANYGGFVSAQESEFSKMTVNQLEASQIYGCPLLIKIAEEIWVAITEANLTDWAGMYLGRDVNQPYTLVTRLSPRLDEPDVLVKSNTRRYSPWRTIMIGSTPGALIESNIVLNLNEPCRIEDTSWIKAGKCAWDRWWCGGYAPDFGRPVGVDQKSMHYFIDFAAEMGWEYQLVDWYWYGAPFDPAKPFSVAGNPAVSILKQADEIDIPGLVRYAAQKDVKILVWLDWYHAEQEMDQAFPLYEKWGVAGVKVDFMNRDDQEMVNFYHRLVKKAVEHHLTVDFHGAYKPTGWQRTWPNLLTREGVLGNEYNKWSDRVTPEHTLILPFTRMLAGPMDFTPGGFRHKSVKDFRIVGSDEPGPFVMGTRSRQLAMMLVYESPLQVLCDSPYNYRSSPAGLDFLKKVPTVWDETRVLTGQVGEYIAIARRAGKSWYIGAMTDSNARTLNISLDFLGAGKYNAHIYNDAPDADEYPEHIQIEKKAVTNHDSLNIIMAPAGGHVIVLEPVK